MKRMSTVLVLVAVAVVMVLAPLAWAADVQGKVKSFAGNMVTLDDGTQIVIPPTLTVEKQALQPGANVKASYDEKDGQKVAKSLTVMPAR